MPYVFNPFTGNLDWTDSGSGVPYTGATQSVDLGEYGLSAGFIKLDTTPTTATGAVGEISWDDGEGTASLVMKGGNVIQKIGEQEYARVYNDSGTTLTLGQVVYISGAQGNRVAVKLARADSELTSRGTIGFVAETMAAGAEGFILVSGALYKLNTLGLTEGTPIYLSSATAGAYTTTAPASPNHLVILGWVERAHATAGSIYVKVDNGYELGELHDVDITSIQDNNVLKYVAANSRWENSSTLSLTGLTLSNFTSGSVPFAGTDGAISQDNTHFNYNSTSDILSVSSGVTERITNGGFTGNASGWTLGSGWTYSSNSVSHSSNGTNALTQSVSVVAGERYEVSFTISNLTVGTVSVSIGGVSLGTFSANGTYAARIVIVNTNAISFAPSNTARLTIDNVSAKLLTGGTVQSGDLLVQGSGATGVVRVAATGKSNSQPGTTRHVLLENNGSDSWIDFKFSNVDRAHIGANSTGQVSTYVSGGNYDAVYNKATNTLISYNTPNVFGHYGSGVFQTGVNAGSTNTPSSTLMSQGGTALKVKYITANQTLDNTATEWIVDPSAAACNGSPTNACSSYTNEFDCLTRDAHGGCSWFAGYDCSVYSGDESSCTSQTGCTWEQASCSAFGDESTCNSYTGCYWTYTPQDCSGFFDEGTCNSYSGCYWDGASCSGTYDSYSCEGTYATGNCTGVYGAACSGTASCGGIDDQTNCNNEPGCNWATAITLTLPQISTVPDRDYWIYNNSSTNADVVLVPTAGDTVDHTSSYTLSTFKDWVHISPFRRVLSCAGLNEGTCASTTGCSIDYYNCSWNVMDAVCEGDPACSGYGDQSSCETATYYGGCSGTYVTSSNWYVFGR